MGCLYVFYVQPEDGHYQAPKHVVVPYVENTVYSTNKYGVLDEYTHCTLVTVMDMFHFYRNRLVVFVYI